MGIRQSAIAFSHLIHEIPQLMTQEVENGGVSWRFLTVNSPLINLFVMTYARLFPLLLVGLLACSKPAVTIDPVTPGQPTPPTTGTPTEVGKPIGSVTTKLIGPAGSTTSCLVGVFA